jgi:hypothetical protein
VRACPTPIVAILLAVGVALPAIALGGCSNGSPDPKTSQSPALSPLDARTRLAGLAAAAQDRHFFAGYALSQSGREVRNVMVVLATDGSWRLDIPGGALSGQANIAVAGVRDGLYQCRLPGSGTTSASCVQVTGSGGVLPSGVDPQLQHPFTDWLDVLTDRRAALSVAAAQPLPGARGTCFSVEPTAAALLAPIDAGIYCYDPDGTLTAVRAGFGTLVLNTPVSPAPPTAVLPGPITTGDPLPLVAPPAPPTTASPSKR